MAGDQHALGDLLGRRRDTRLRRLGCEQLLVAPRRAVGEEDWAEDLDVDGQAPRERGHEVEVVLRVAVEDPLLALADGLACAVAELDERPLGVPAHVQARRVESPDEVEDGRRLGTPR